MLEMVRVDGVRCGACVVAAGSGATMQEWHALRHRRTRETIGRKVRQTRLLRETGRRKELVAFDWSMSAPTATTLAFAPEFASTEFRLVELPAHVWDALGTNALYGVCLGARLDA